jgi:hypothetical protein
VAASSKLSTQLATIGTTFATSAARDGATGLEAYEKKHAPEQIAEARKDFPTEYKQIETDFKEEEVYILSLISFDFLNS